MAYPTETMKNRNGNKRDENKKLKNGGRQQSVVETIPNTQPPDVQPSVDTIMSEKRPPDVT